MIVIIIPNSNYKGATTSGKPQEKIYESTELFKKKAGDLRTDAFDRFAPFRRMDLHFTQTDFSRSQSWDCLQKSEASGG